ncbi:MAG: helix-turn-helix domain-containing protein [Armatimonadetes bacterium]|nr:helix-turn-helix domain-containing protein [Armatimonadota bacterium]
MKHSLDVKAIRSELGLSQSEFAALAGVSKRAIQSYEQDWRQPSEMVERVLLLLLIAHRNKGHLEDEQCWEVKECPPKIRKQCIAYVARQGHICWFFTGTMCSGKKLPKWADKIQTCLQCRFMQRMLKTNGEEIGLIPTAYQ